MILTWRISTGKLKFWPACWTWQLYKPVPMSKFMENWASFTGPLWANTSSRQRTFVMHGYPDLQKAWNRTGNTPLVAVINSKMMPFKELGLGVKIFSGKKSEIGQKSTEWLSLTQRGFQNKQRNLPDLFLVPRPQTWCTKRRLESTAKSQKTNPKPHKRKNRKLNQFPDTSITAKKVSCITSSVKFYSLMTFSKLQYRTYFSDTADCVLKWNLQIKCKHEPKQTSCK